jgi:hypothetical protein
MQSKDVESDIDISGETGSVADDSPTEAGGNE